MTNFDARDIYQSSEFQQELAIQRSFMARVYGWMTIGLLVTALTALVITSSRELIDVLVVNGVMRITLVIAWAVAGFTFAFLIQRIPATVATALFVVYSVLTGAALAGLVLVYTQSSLAATFFITAGMFGSMSAFGYITKRDLSGMGSFLMMGLWGILIAMVVNIFLRSSAMEWIISFIGVIIFTGLAAYDTQKIKRSYAAGAQGSAAYKKTALFGAFMLYLDFINLFLFLLQFMGNSRD